MINALQQLDQSIDVEVWTSAPKHLFDDSIFRPISYFQYSSDVGLVQRTPMNEDIPATVDRLKAFLPFDGTTIESLAQRLRDQRCDLVVCDIAPLGIVVGREAEVPTVLIENFTWDWIYSAYAETEPEILPYVAYLETVFQSADYHIRAEPACGDSTGDLMVKPIGRRARRPPEQIREALGFQGHEKMVLVTFGGTPGAWNPIVDMDNHADVVFVVPTAAEESEAEGNAVRFLARSKFYHPDLIGAADVLISKLGYSTIAEAYYAGVPFGFLRRPDFRESAVLERFVSENLPSLCIGVQVCESADWEYHLARLLELPRVDRIGSDGAHQAADFILRILD